MSKNKAKAVRPIFWLSEFIDRVNAQARRAAMDDHLSSAAHDHCLLAGVFAKQCRKSTREALLQ